MPGGVVADLVGDDDLAILVALDCLPRVGVDLDDAGRAGVHERIGAIKDAYLQVAGLDRRNGDREAFATTTDRKLDCC